MDEPPRTVKQPSSAPPVDREDRQKVLSGTIGDAES